MKTSTASSVASRVVTSARLALPRNVPPRIVFHHIPKCGGTSLESAMRRALFGPLRGALPRRARRIGAEPSARAAQCVGVPLEQFRQGVLLYEVAQGGTRFVSGHVPFSERIARELDAPSWLFMTMVREPVDRFLSQYWYTLHSASGHFAHDLSLSDYLETEVAEALGVTLMSYLVGEVPPEGLRSDQALRRASRNLSNFSLVGALEQLDDFCTGFEQVTGRSLRVPHINQSPNPPSSQGHIISHDLRDRIVEICHWDLLLYRVIRDHIAGRSHRGQ